ncbi:MAG: hypothetical protein M1830_007541, partial [Pleopsidium flavum]
TSCCHPTSSRAGSAEHTQRYRGACSGLTSTARCVCRYLGNSNEIERAGVGPPVKSRPGFRTR